MDARFSIVCNFEIFLQHKPLVSPFITWLTSALGLSQAAVQLVGKWQCTDRTCRTPRPGLVQRPSPWSLGLFIQGILIFSCAADKIYWSPKASTGQRHFFPHLLSDSVGGGTLSKKSFLFQVIIFKVFFE
jgi:hypothetical protein